MPLGNDPTPLAELEAGFGVTSSAEQLIIANASSLTQEQRAGMLKDVNEDLTSELRDNLDQLEDHLGHEVVNASVRGSGASALIHYVYIGPRDSHEQGYVPFADVLGDDLLKRRREQLVARRGDPDEAAREAEQKVALEANAEAARVLQNARDEAEQLLNDTKQQIADMIAEAREEANQARLKAAEKAPEEADKAREEAEKAKADADEPDKRGDGGTGVSGTASGRTASKPAPGKAGGKGGDK